MNLKKRLCLTISLAAILLAALTVTTVSAECPPTAQIWVRDEVTDTTAVRGTEANPAKDMNEAFDICGQCAQGGVIRYGYDATADRYTRRTSCGLIIPPTSGAPLAQSILTILLGLIAVGLLVWGIYQRRRLNRLQPK